MTAPIVSLPATPPGMGGQSAGPAVGAAANNDDVFGALVAAMFEAAQGAGTPDQSAQQPQSPQSVSPQSLSSQSVSPQPVLPPQQIAQATDTHAAANAGKSALTVGEVTLLNLLQTATTVTAVDASPSPSTVLPVASGQGSAIHKDGSQTMPAPLSSAPAPVTDYLPQTTQAPLTSAGKPEDTALVDEPSATGAASASDILQEEKQGAASAGDMQAVAGIPAQISPLLETETKPSGGSNGTQSAVPAFSRANSRTAARHEQDVTTDDKAQQPLITVSSLPDMGPAVTAQFLAGQPAPAAPNVATPIIAATEPQNEAGNFTETPQPGDTEQIAEPRQQIQPAATDGSRSADAIDALKQSIDSFSFGESATQPAEASPAPVQIAQKSAENIKASEPETTQTAVSPASNHPDATIAADAAGLAGQQAPISVPDSAPVETATTIPSDTPALQTSGAANRATPSTTGTALPSTQDDNDVSSDPADRQPVTTAAADAKTKDDSRSAIRRMVSSTEPVAPAAADMTPAVSAGDPTDRPGDTTSADASNNRAQAAVINAVMRPATALAHDVVASAATPAETISPDTSGRPAALSRATRGPVRSGSGANRDAVNAPSQAPASSAPDAAPAPEKSQPVRATDSAQTDAAKTVSQPAPTHAAESAPEPDAPKAHDPADLTPAADTVQPQAAKTETAAASAAPQPQPAAIDVAPLPSTATYGFEQPTAYAGAPHQDDVPVRLAFNAPQAPDNSAFDALALRIASHSSDGDSHFSIRLDPPELGKIEVNLNVDAHGHAQAELSADKPQTLELLQKDASTLERALKDAGLNLSGGLAFSLKGDGRSQAWRDSQNGRSRGVQIAAADAASASAAMTSRAALAAQAYGLPMSNLDIRV